MSQLTIEHIVSSTDMGDATEQDARTWADHVEKRLREKFPGASINVSVNNRQSGATNVDGEQDQIDAVHQFMDALWDREFPTSWG